MAEKRFKKGTWKYIKHAKIRSWAHNKEQEYLAGKEKKNGKEGHAYIFSLEHDGLYKIGYTYNIQKRLRSLQIVNPNLRCIWSAWSKDMCELEKRLHVQFDTHKIERELFALTPGDIRHANEIANQFRKQY